MRIALLLVLVPIHSLAADNYEEVRKAEAAKAIEIYDKAKYELVNDRFLLITLRSPVSRAHLIDVAKSAGVNISAVYWCIKGAGVLSLYLDPNQSVPDQLQRAEQGKDSAENQIASFARGSSSVGQSAARASDFHSYCGFEAQGQWSSLRALRSSLEPSIQMLEISTARVRLMPLNLIN